MMAFKFKLSDVQDSPTSLVLNAGCLNVDLAHKDNIELEFSGDNLVCTPDKVALKDIFDQASGHAFCRVEATPQQPGSASAVMQVKINGNDFAQITQSFTLG